MLLAIYIVYYIMSNLTTGAGVFCATYYWGDGSLLGQFSMMKMFPVIIALAIAPVLIKRPAVCRRSTWATPSAACWAFP